MSANSTNQGEEEDEDSNNTIVLEKEELMVSSSGNPEIPSLEKAHFLKPLYKNPTKKNPLPKPPSHFLPPDQKCMNKLKKNNVFKGKKVQPLIWKKWVDDLLPTHQIIWKKVGIFDAIKASTYDINGDDELIIDFAHHWCVETNSFVFRWGECSITLEDVMILGGFSVLGECVISDSKCKRFDVIKGKLGNVCGMIRSRCDGQVNHFTWMKYFRGHGGKLEHVGFLVQWLSSYVFCTDSYDVNTLVFAVAIKLAEGVKIALAPAVLASIYRDLGLLKRKIVVCDGEHRDYGLNLVVCSPIHLVRVWALERFPGFGLIPNRLVHGEPRVSRWHAVCMPRNRHLRLNMRTSLNDFMWRPYCTSLDNWEFPKFYCDKGMWLLVNSEVDEELLSYVRCLRPCELVSLDCVEQYLPHRVGKQFGFSQDIPGLIPGFIATVELASSSYEIPLDGLKVYLPCRMLKGSVTVGYYDWWRPIVHIRDGALMASQREIRCLRRRLRKKGKVSSLRTSRLSLARKSRKCNEIIDLDSLGSDKDKSGENSSPLKKSVSQTPLSMANDAAFLHVTNPLIGVQNTNLVECIPTAVNEMNGNNNCDRSYSQGNSLVAVNKAGSVKEPIQCPDTENDHRDTAVGAEVNKTNSSFKDVNMNCDGGRAAESSERLCRRNKRKGKEIFRVSSPSNNAMGAELAYRHSPPPEQLPSDDVMNVVNEIHQLNVLNPLRGPEVNMVSLESHESGPSKVPENAEHEKTALHDPIIVSDKEESNDLATFESVVWAFEYRIKKIERTISRLNRIKTAKFR